MKDMKMTKDKRLTLVEALIRYADECGNDNPQFYKDELLKKLDVCDHVFNVMQKQLGDKYCRVVDCFEERSRYAVNVNKCLELRNQLIQASTKERRYQDSVRITLLATSISTFLVILLGRYII